MDTVVLILIIAAAVLAAYGVWIERGRSPVGWAVLCLAAAVLIPRVT